jgi:uncharacterized protein (TIGR02246 family)
MTHVATSAPLRADRPAPPALNPDQEEIQRIIAGQLRAVCAKDLDGIMEGYADDAVIFDVKPPFRTKGKDAWRKMWMLVLPYLPDCLDAQTRDLKIMIDGDLAVAHWMFRFRAQENAQYGGQSAPQTWMRVTCTYQRMGGKWCIVHEHSSVPFDPVTGKAMFSLES